MKLDRVEEAVERNPLRKARVVEVEFSPEPKVVKGKAKVENVGQLVLQSPEIQRIVVEAYWEERSVAVAFAKFWRALQLFALERLRTIFLATPPLYEPENVSEELPAVKSARFEPREIPEIVEFCN